MAERQRRLKEKGDAGMLIPFLLLRMRDSADFLQIHRKSIHFLPDFWRLFEQGGEHALHDVRIQFNQFGGGNHQGQIPVDIMPQSGQLAVQFFDLRDG